MRSLLRFGVDQPVPVNLLMMAVIVGGLAAGLTLRRTFFPEADPDTILVTMPYPGASPEEIEGTLGLKVEDALAELDEVDELRTTISEGAGVVQVKLREGVDPDKALDEVQRKIDGLTDLPEESEQIQPQLLEIRLPVIRLTAYGELSEAQRKTALRAIKDDLRSLPRMGETLTEGVRDYQIRVDIDQAALVRQGISLPEVSSAIGGWLADVPGGTVKSESGDIKVRTLGIPERAEAIGGIVVKADAEGGVVRVRDLGTVRDGFDDQDVIMRFNGEPAAFLTVFKVGDQDIVNMAEMVRAYVAGRTGEPFHATWMERLTGSDALAAWKLGHTSPRALPAGTKLGLTSDLARFVEGRLDLLLRNAVYGAILVFATLLLILNWRVAVWVGVGLITALLGTVLLMQALDITLNLLTMFGLIVVLGLLVDDAIVVSENIQRRHDGGEGALSAAVEGAQQVAWPVVATVMTTVVAFLPLSFIKGRIGELLGALPVVVACALIMSLLEGLLILPSHMGHSLKKRDDSHPGRAVSRVRRIEQRRDDWIANRLTPAFGRMLHGLIRFRYVSVAGALAVLIVSLGMVAGGRVVFNFLPASDAETIIVNLQMPVGTATEKTNRVVQAIERAAEDQPEVRSIASGVGFQANIDTGQNDASAPHLAQMFIELYPVEQRNRESSQVIAAIRSELRGKMDEVERISYEEITGGPGGPDITVQIAGEQARVNRAAVALKQELAGYAGVRDVADDNDLGQAELQVRLRPGASTLGLSVRDVAQQVRGYLYGLDAHTFADRQEDIDVRVRLGEATRRNITAIEQSWILSPVGGAVPLAEVATLSQDTTYATIRRVDRQRAVTVTADTDPALSPEQVIAGLTQPRLATPGWAKSLPDWLARFVPKVQAGPSRLDQLRAAYPDLSFTFAGRQEQMSDAFASLPYGMLAAVIMVYVILAWLFSSYVQPLVVLSVAPFAVVGVVWGHLLMGYQITFLSLIGFVALIGIVVNDSLIFVEFYNHQRREGDAGVREALVAAGQARLRAIVLTTVTTVFGLTPLILERSFQAKFLIPMAIAIAGGLLSATLVVLIVLPCFMAVLDDLRGLSHYLWHGRRREAEEFETTDERR